VSHFPSANLTDADERRLLDIAETIADALSERDRDWLLSYLTPDRRISRSNARHWLGFHVEDALAYQKEMERADAEP
jgi:hypothetical protein